jgi:hypothetical protein
VLGLLAGVGAALLVFGFLNFGEHGCSTHGAIQAVAGQGECGDFSWKWCLGIGLVLVSVPGATYQALASRGREH